MKIVKIAFSQDKDPMFFGLIENNGNKITTKHLLTLVDFTIKNGSVSWVVRTEKGALLCGGNSSIKIPETFITMTPSIPITLHKRATGLAPEFIFKVPYEIQVYPLKSIKKKYPNAAMKRDIFGRNL
jgi:hypothetical protein